MSLPPATLPCAFLLAWCGAARADDAIAKEIFDGQRRVILGTKADEPVILRLDLEMESLLERARRLPDDRQADFLASGLSPQQRLYANFGMPNLPEFARYLLGKASYPKVNLHREAFAGRDLSTEIRSAYRCCVKVHGKPLPKAPLYKVAFGYQRTTSAQMQGVDPSLNRHIVVLNRSALASGRLWDAAVIHETWHCFQESIAGKQTLWERALHEGVVTYLTQVADPTLDDATVMLWTPDEWEAAVKNRDAIARAFAKARRSTDAKEIGAFMQLGAQLTDVPGAPSRSGYFLAYLAAKAWHEAQPERGPAELIATSAEDIWEHFAMASGLE